MIFENDHKRKEKLCLSVLLMNFVFEWFDQLPLFFLEYLAFSLAIFKLKLDSIISV